MMVMSNKQIQNKPIIEDQSLPKGLCSVRAMFYQQWVVESIGTGAMIIEMKHEVLCTSTAIRNEYPPWRAQCNEYAWKSPYCPGSILLNITLINDNELNYPFQLINE